MELRAIDADREMLLDFYVSDAVRGLENPGLSLVETEAMRLVVDHERAHGRELVGKGAIHAASRMLDNAFGADDGAYELAQLMASDLAFQRHAAEVVAAGERFGAEGTMPERGDWPDAYVKYVIPDIAEDEDARNDWKAMAEGRFHEVSSMSEDIFRDGVKAFEQLPEDSRTWIYDMASKGEDYSPGIPRSLDALDMAEMADRDAMTAPQAAKALADGLKELGYEVAETSDRMDFTKIVLVREGGFTEADLQDVRNYAENFQFDTSDIRITREGDLTVDVTGAGEYPPRQPEYEPSFNDVQEWLAGEPARHEWTAEEEAARIGGYLGQYRHGKMMEEGRNPTNLVSSVCDMQSDGAGFPDDILKGAERLAHMVDAKDPRTDDLARSLAEEVMSFRGVGAGAAEYWNFMDGEVQRLPDMLRTVAQQDRGSATTRAIDDVIAKGFSQSTFEAVRMDMATGPEEAEYQPFRAATSAELEKASREIGHVEDAIRYDDRTIMVDEGLNRAVRLLKDAGMPMNEHRVEALERAFVRADAHEAEKGPLSPNEKARMIVYDVSTQEEARGLHMATRGNSMDAARGAAIARTAGAMVTKLGIRTLTQEGLDDADLGKAAAGRFEEVSAYHRAGIHLGTSWARDGVRGSEEVDRRMERLVYGDAADIGGAGQGLKSLSSGGIVGREQQAIEFAALVGGGIASQARSLEASTPTKAKGARDMDDVLRRSLGIGRDGGRD